MDFYFSQLIIIDNDFHYSSSKRRQDEMSLRTLGYDSGSWILKFLKSIALRVIIPCPQYAKLNFNPNPRSNQKHDK